MVFHPEEGYLRDILVQPQALAATQRHFEQNFSLGSIPQQLADGKFKRIVLTGMGSSHFIFYPLYYELVKQTLPVTLIEGAELIHFAPELIQQDTLIITASQSGNSAETVHMLDLNQTRGAAILGITNTADSVLAQRADCALVTQAGPEATVSCKTYLAALLGLRWLQDALFGRDLTPAQKETAVLPALVHAYLEHWQEHVDFMEKDLSDQSLFFMCGRGSSLAAVMTSSLTAKEATICHVEGMSSPALRHGPKEMMRAGTYVMVYAGLNAVARSLNRALAADLSAQGARVAWIGSDAVEAAYRLPEVPAGLLPMLESLPGQMFNLALSDLHGHTAGTFQHASKVTTIE